MLLINCTAFSSVWKEKKGGQLMNLREVFKKMPSLLSANKMLSLRLLKLYLLVHPIMKDRVTIVGLYIMED